MSAPFEVNHSIYGQHLSQAVDAVLIAPKAESLYGYATLSGTREHPENEVHAFPDWESMALALSSTFDGRLLSDLYPDVCCFAPDKPPRLRLVVEADDLDDEEAVQ